MKRIKSPVLKSCKSNQATHVILFIYLFNLKITQKSFKRKIQRTLNPFWLCLSYVKLPQVSKFNDFKPVRPSSYDLFLLLLLFQPRKKKCEEKLKFIDRRKECRSGCTQRKNRKKSDQSFGRSTVVK